jgi:hypothetical protein
MAKDPRFDPEYQKTQQTRESTNQIQGKEIGNSTILTEHLANGSVTSDKTSFNKLVVANQQLLADLGNNTIVTPNVLWSLFAIKGTRLYTDENFASGSNSIVVYNNLGGTAVTHTRKNTGFVDATAFPPPNSSGFVIEIRHAPATSNGTTPGYGGWFFANSTAASRQFVCVFTMKIPIGRSLSWHSNQIGDNGTATWLTDTAGTGKYETYAFFVNSGISGIFSSTMFFALNGGDTSVFYTYLSNATVFDVTQR